MGGMLEGGMEGPASSPHFVRPTWQCRGAAAPAGYLYGLSGEGREVWHASTGWMSNQPLDLSQYSRGACWICLCRRSAAKKNRNRGSRAAGAGGSGSSGSGGGRPGMQPPHHILHHLMRLRPPPSTRQRPLAGVWTGEGRARAGRSNLMSRAQGIARAEVCIAAQSS